MLKVTAQSIADELHARSVPFDVLDESHGLIRYKKGATWKLLRSSVSSDSSSIGGFLADRKQLVAKALQHIALQMPATIEAESANTEPFLAEHETVVVKPANSAHGNGVTTNVSDVESLHSAVELAQTFGDGTVIVQQQVEGDDIRVLVIGGVYTAAAIRNPAHVTGDATHTIRQLIEKENTENNDRGKAYQKRLNYIDVQVAERYLGSEMDERVPGRGESVRVAGPANIGTGGESTDITRAVPATIQVLAEQIAGELGLPTCGVDFMAKDVSDAGTYYFIEVNTCPSFGMHLRPSKGEPQPVAKKFVDFIMRDV